MEHPWVENSLKDGEPGVIDVISNEGNARNCLVRALENGNEVGNERSLLGCWSY